MKQESYTLAPEVRGIKVLFAFGLREADIVKLGVVRKVLNSDQPRVRGQASFQGQWSVLIHFLQADPTSSQWVSSLKQSEAP